MAAASAAVGSIINVVPTATFQSPKHTENEEQHRLHGSDLLRSGRGMSASPTPDPARGWPLGSNPPKAAQELEEEEQQAVILRQLRGGQGLEAIRALRAHLHRYGGRLSLNNGQEVLEELVALLQQKNGRREVRASCLQLVSELVQAPGEEFDSFRLAILPGLVRDLKDESPVVRKELVQTLHKCLKFSRSPQDVFVALAKYGLDSPDPEVRTATAVTLPVFLTKDLLTVDLYGLVVCLAKKLSSGADDPLVAFCTMNHIRAHVGQEEFNSYLKRLPSALKQDYSRFVEENYAQLSSNGAASHMDKNLGIMSPRRTTALNRSHTHHPVLAASRDSNSSKFAFISQELHARLLNQEDYKARIHAVEELRCALLDMDLTTVPSPSLIGFISLLCSLLDDNNFKVMQGSLEILALLVVKLGPNAEPFLRPIVSATVKVLGDSKVVTKQECMNVCMGLMKTVGPQKLLDLLLENIKHKNSRVREEVISIIIASLLTFPSEDFDLPKLCFAVAPSLADSKRKVRHAALEVFAVLASSMGSGKMQPLVKAVDQVELQQDVEGLMAAVQARLARRVLPKLTSQGLVEYAVPIPSSAVSRGIHMVPQGADMEWLLGGGRTQSAHSYHGEPDSDLGQGYMSPLPFCEDPPTHRRVLSAGKGKNKLPWENTGSTAPIDQVSRVYSEVPSSPRLKLSSAMLAKDDPYLARKSAAKSIRSLNGLDGNCENSSTSTNTDVHHPRISGKKGLLGSSRKSGSVDSELQLLGTNQQLEKSSLHGSLNFVTKQPRTFYNHANVERTFSFPTSGSGYGVALLPSYPLSSAGGGSLNSASPAVGRPVAKVAEQCVSLPSTSPGKQENIAKSGTPRRLPNCKAEGPSAEGIQDKHSPVPLMPALVRSPSHRGLGVTKPVPPIPRKSSPFQDWTEGAIGGDSRKMVLNQDIGGVWESSSDKPSSKTFELNLSELHLKDEDLDHEEMISSLRSVRNSAAKKRAKMSGSVSDPDSPDSAFKSELTLDSPCRTSSPFTSPVSESGVYSLQDSLISPSATTPRSRRTGSGRNSPLTPRMHVPRVSSGQAKSSHAMDYTPIQGVISRDKATTDVSIIGQRMGYANGLVEQEDGRQRDSSPPFSKMHVTKEQQKAAKQAKGIYISASGAQHIGNQDNISGSGMSEDTVVIVGKGVFGSPTSSLTGSQSSMSSIETTNCINKPNTEPLSGIYGKSVQHISLSNFENSDPTEKEMKVAISKSARDKMRQKRKEEKIQNYKEQVEKREKNDDHLRERLKHIDLEKPPPEGLAVNGDVLLKPRTESQSAELPLSSPPLKRTSSIRKTHSSNAGDISAGSQPQRKERAPSVPSSSEIIDSSELRPFSKPDLALAEAFRLLADDDWEKKIEGLNFLRSLSAFHSDVLMTKVHEAVLAVIKEVKNLRSGVSRAAVVCLGDMFANLKKGMDQELDNSVKVLLHKAGESNTFIREDVDKTLDTMVNSVTLARALSALVTGGGSHLNAVVRKCAAQHLADVVEKMGPGRLLSGIKDITDKLLPAVAKFAQDSSQETRFHGRRMLFVMMSHQDFEKMLEKYLQPKDLPYIKEAVGNLRLKGLGEMPLDASSAKGRRSHLGSGGSIRASSSSREPLNLSGRDIGESVWKPSPRNLVENTEFVKQLTGLLNAKDFRDRTKGIEQLLADCERNPDLIISNIFPIFDAFKSRLHDPNSKVNLLALESMQKIIILLKDNLGQVIHLVVPAVVDNNLNSKNNGIYIAANSVLQCLVDNIDKTLLLQPFCMKAQFLNGKAKQDMTEKVADLVTELHPRKPQVVEQKVLPLLWHLLGNMTSSGSLPGKGGNIRAATIKLCKALHANMGPSLLDLAANQSGHISKTLQEVLEIPT
ncbi:TOG array regulator of axonemal microtubules protein 1 [Polypterus senegalus]|uniref:TOG array regulator of axonemal microtubules protein 1 n=1 Tax=Polypterus senegalus TaxID=55291 RepID=UPI001966CBCB|nr:TOG array regulator of axonemal microtubules protein 1 [Polypterus senegalus]